LSQSGVQSSERMVLELPSSTTVPPAAVTRIASSIARAPLTQTNVTSKPPMPIGLPRIGWRSRVPPASARALM
jgi:hypothetical protein